MLTKDDILRLIYRWHAEYTDEYCGIPQRQPCNQCKVLTRCRMFIISIKQIY